MLCCWVLNGKRKALELLPSQLNEWQRTEFRNLNLVYSSFKYSRDTVDGLYIRYKESDSIFKYSNLECFTIFSFQRLLLFLLLNGAVESVITSHQRYRAAPSNTLHFFIFSNTSYTQLDSTPSTNRTHIICTSLVVVKKIFQVLSHKISCDVFVDYEESDDDEEHTQETLKMKWMKNLGGNFSQMIWNFNFSIIFECAMLCVSLNVARELCEISKFYIKSLMF